MRRFVHVILGLIAFAAVAVALGVAWLDRPLTLPATPFAFEVRPGATLKTVARELAAANVVPDERIVVALARLRGIDRTIKAGNYELGAGVTLPQLLAKLTQGDVTQDAVTIVEGATFAEMRAALASNRNIAPATPPLADAELMARLGLPGMSPEGWFFPDTYFFAAGTGDFALLRRAHALMRARLEAAWAARASDLPFKEPYEALILASIVEKETGRAADRPLIASVFVNRLRIGMRLQTDPTVIYGMGAKFDGNLRRRDLETDTRWNTYLRDGLPPTPISLPGQRSLDAVLNPPKTQYLYFVARGDGTSEFSTNLADHNRAVARFQKGVR